MTDQEPPVDDVRKAAMYGGGERGPFENTDMSGNNSKYQEFKHRRDKERDAEAEKKVDAQSVTATAEYNKDPVVKESRKMVDDAKATMTPEEAAEVEDAESEHVDNVFQERAQAAEAARIQGVKDRAQAAAEARANEEHVDPFQNSDYVPPTEEEVAERKKEQLRQRDEYNDQVFQEEQERKRAEQGTDEPEEEGPDGTYKPLGGDIMDDPISKYRERRDAEAKAAEEEERRRKQEEYNAMVNSDDPNVRLQTIEGLTKERNEIAMQHMKKMVNAFAQTAAEMGGQMVSKGWDLAGNIVKMTFTQPHAMSSTSRMIGTAMSALQTAGDFADRSVQKYGIDVNADPNLMKNTIRYKLYKREAEMGKNAVGNTFRTISESLGNMGLQDASQMTPDQLDRHVQDMRAEADRLTQALKDPKLSNSERSLIKAQAQHLQGYMDGLAKQGAGMAQDQRIAARRQKRQDLATRKQNYRVLADGSPNPYREALEWADPRFGIEVDPQTGRPTNPSAYNRMLNAVITQRQNEAAAAERAGKKLDPAREKWFNDLQNKIYNDIQAMKQDKAENPLRGRAEIYARIGRVAPGFEKYIDNIEQTGTFPSNSTQSTRAMRKVLSDYLFELKDAGKEGSPEYNHAKAILTSMDKYNNMKKLMSRIAGVMPHGAERAKRIHEATENDPYVKEDFSDNGKIKDYTKLVEAYAHLMEHLPRDPVKGGNFNPEDEEYQHYEGIFNDNLTYFVNKWFPGAGWGKGGEEEEGGDAGGTPGGGAPGGPSLDDFFSDDEGEDDGGSVPPGGAPRGASPEEQIDPESGDDIDQFIAEALRRIGMGEPFDEEAPQPENPNPAPQPPPGGPSPQPPADPKKADKKADARFRTTFPETQRVQLRERLSQLGFTFDKYGMVTDPQKFQDFKDQFLKLGVSESAFNKKFGAMTPLRMRSFAEQVYIARKQLAFGPEGAQNKLGSKNVSANRLGAFLVDRPDMAELMSKKIWGEPLTEEEELSVQKALFDAGLISRIKTKKGDVPLEQEQSETPIEGEAEQPQLPAVTENDFIKPEVASQFKNAGNIENINNGIAAIQSMDRNKRAAGYNDLLYGLGNEIGNDALFSEEYQNLMQTAFMDGSSRAIQLRANQAQDPADKLKTLMAGRLVAPDSNDSKRMLKEFLDNNVKDYDSGEVDKVVNGVLKQVQQAQSDKDREKIINNFLESDLSPDLFNHKEREKEGDETPSEEEAVDPAKFAEEVVGSLDPSLFPTGDKDENPVDPNTIDQFEAGGEQVVEEPAEEGSSEIPETVEFFEQDDNSPKGLFFPENSPYKDFKTMAEAMGKELGITVNTKQKKAREAIDDWLSSHNIGYENGVDADSLKDEIVTYLRKNGLISTKKDMGRKNKDKGIDLVLEEAKSALAEGPAADKESISKDKRKVNDFKGRIRKKYADKRDRERVIGLFDDFMKDYEANLKEQYSNHSDMAWRSQAIQDFLKWDRLSSGDREKLTPKKKSEKGKNNKASDEETYSPLDEAPEYDPSKRDDFINELREFKKYDSNGRLKGAYIATVKAHDKALDTIQIAIADVDKEIAQGEKSRGAKGWTLQDEDHLEDLYNKRSLLIDRRKSWEKSKELVEYNDMFANVYGVFSELSDRARSDEAISADELKSLEDGISTLKDDDQKMFAPLMDYLKSKISKSVRDSYIKDYAALQQELEKLKNDGESLKKERELDDARSSINEMLEGFESGVLEITEDNSKALEDLINKLPSKEKSVFRKKLEKIRNDATKERIRKMGNFKEGSDPTKWLKEISECTDRDVLNKKVAAYEQYIATLPDNAKKGEYGSLDRAKEKANVLINSWGMEELAVEFIKRIQEYGYHEFDINENQYMQQLMGGPLSDKEYFKARELWNKVQEAKEISKILEDKFGVTYSDFTSDKVQSGVQNDMWKILANKVRDAYLKGNEGSGLAQEYKTLVKKMHLKPIDEDFAIKMLNAAIPKEQTTKSLSIRDFFRARNPDWE